MAKIQINADTETGDLSVTIGGEAILNISSVELCQCPSWDDPTDIDLRVMINSYEEKKDSGVKKYTTLIAKDCDKGRAALEKGAKLDKKHTAFVSTGGTDKGMADIAKAFGRKK